MIVVSIVGLLASLAIPAYERFLLRSKRAEFAVNVEGIRLTEEAYRAEWDIFTSCAISPSTIPGRVAVSFPANETTSLDWNHIGWVPDGRVYGQYRVVANAQPGALTGFVADSFGDIDGDGNLSNVQGTELLKPALLTPNNVF